MPLFIIKVYMVTLLKLYPDSNPKCEHHLDYLYELFENSATEAVYLIQNFNNALYGDVLF